MLAFTGDLVLESKDLFNQRQNYKIRESQVVWLNTVTKRQNICDIWESAMKIQRIGRVVGKAKYHLRWLRE